MEFGAKLQPGLAEKVLPPPLYEALLYLFREPIDGCALVGGSALSGFYAGHRRSDDLDLFTKDTETFEATIYLVRSLKEQAVEIVKEFRTPSYYRATCISRKHAFTVDVVEDSNLFRVGGFETLPNHVVVADLKTLLMTKAATLVSRASEKDLYDLLWMFEHSKNLKIVTLIELAQEIDGGATVESMLMALSGARLKEEACQFALSGGPSAKVIYKELVVFQKQLLENFMAYAKNQPVPPLSELTAEVRRFKK